MSCFICDQRTIGIIAHGITRTLEKMACYPDEIPAILKAFGDCKYLVNKRDRWDEHLIYRKLYIENLKAYNYRYNENIREMPKFIAQEEPDKIKLHKATHCYMYQISEEATGRGDVIKGVQEYCYILADQIARTQWNNDVWD